MQRSLRLLALLVVVGFVVSCHCDDVVPVASTEDVGFEIVTTERDNTAYGGCQCAGDNSCPKLSSDGLQEMDCEQCCAVEEQFTTMSAEPEESSTTQQSEITVSSAVTTTTTTTTAKPSARTHGRMVRFGGKRRMSRPTTTEPTQRKPTVNSRTLLNRRGLFNPELRNRYLGRFRSTTTAEPTN